MAHNDALSILTAMMNNPLQVNLSIHLRCYSNHPFMQPGLLGDVAPKAIILPGQLDAYAGFDEIMSRVLQEFDAKKFNSEKDVKALPVNYKNILLKNGITLVHQSHLHCLNTES